MFWNNGITTKNEHRIFLLVAVLLSAMILPSIPLHPSLPNMRPEEILLFGVFGLNVLAFIFKGFKFRAEEKAALLSQKKELKLIITIFALLTASYFISNIYGVYIRKAGYYGLRDLMELITFFKYFLVLTLALSVDIGEEEYDFLSKAFLSGILFLMLFGWGQHFNILDFNAWFSPYFDQAHWELLFVGNPVRVLGSFDNPNYFGIFTVITLAYLTVRYYFGEDNGKFPWVMLIAIGLVIKLEFLTISRTAFAGIALLFAILSLSAFLYHRRNKKIVVKIIVLLLLTLVLFATASTDFFYRLHEGLDFSNSTSLQGHLDRLGAAVGSIWESPVFGWGTQKYAMTTLVDNEYALYARRYGFVGLAIYLAFFLTPFILGLKFLKKRIKLKGRGAPLDRPAWFVAAYVAVLPSVFVFNFLAGVFYNLQIMTIFAIAMGLVYNSLKNRYSEE
jgi:O-antigen ligase